MGQPENRNYHNNDSTVCNMGDFFKAYAQAIALIIGGTVSLMIIAVILMFSIPPYLNWSANQSVQRSEAKGRAELARSTVEAEILVEIAHAESAAMGVLAIGQSSSSVTRADAIRSIGDAARRYPEYARDEYLLALANAINKGDFEGVLPYPVDGGLLTSE